MAMNGLLDDGDEVLIPSPDYPLWTAAVSLSGGRPVHYHCDEGAGWLPDLDAVVEQAVHGHHDEFADAVADEDVVQLHPGDLLDLGVVHDRLARGEQALGIRVAGCGGKVGDHVLADLVGRVEAERREIADVQLDDAVALVFELPGPGHHRAADVVADVGEFGRLADRLHGLAGRRDKKGSTAVPGGRCRDEPGMNPV